MLVRSQLIRFKFKKVNRKIFIRWFATAILLGSFLTGITGQTANASAYGVSNWGPGVPVLNVNVPFGTYSAFMVGTRTYVNYVTGYPNLNVQIGTLCNWNITAEFFDSGGNWYKTLSSPVYSGCVSYWHQAGNVTIGVNAYMRPGRMCSTLKSNGGRLTSVCHSITA